MSSKLQFPSFASGPIDSTIDDRIEHYRAQKFQWLSTQKSPTAKIKLFVCENIMNSLFL